MNKYTLFFIIPLAVLSVLALLSLAFMRFSRDRIQPFTPTPTAITNYPIPTSVTIKSKGVDVNNPYIGAKEHTKEGDALSVKTEDFEIAYLGEFDEFVITVNTEPFEEKRRLAEEALLKRLGVSEADACKLKVNISPPKKGDDLIPRYGLSFCE